MTEMATSVRAEEASSVDELLREAMAALRVGDIQRAAEVADEARQLSQSSAVLLVFAAISHSLGRDVEALSMLDQAMKLTPGISNYPEAVAAITLKLGRKADGLFHLKLGTYLPSDPFLDEIVGKYFGDIKDIFSSFIENRPLRTARLMIEQGMFSGALHHLETYIGVSGGDIESFALISECAIHLGAWREAEVGLEALIALAPDHPNRADIALGIAILKGDPTAVAAAIDELPRLDRLGDSSNYT